MKHLKPMVTWGSPILRNPRGINGTGWFRICWFSYLPGNDGVGSVKINEKLVGNSACLVQVAQSPDFPQTAFMPCANPTLWDGSRNTPMASCYCSWLGVWLSETSFCGLRRGLPLRPTPVTQLEVIGPFCTCFTHGNLHSYAKWPV